MYDPNLDIIYTDILDKMKQDKSESSISTKLKDLKNNSERFKLVYENIVNYKMFPKFINSGKSQHQSEVNRYLGNKEYKSKNNASALKMYNLAVSIAPLDTPELCLAYSNRSAVNYTLGNYTACLEDIKRALAMYCDDKIRVKLLKRKEMCEKECAEEKSEDDIDADCARQFKLTKKQIPSMPAASASVKLMYSDEMGRGVVATRDIEPGEVVALEKPYCYVLLHSYFTEYCYGCLKQSDSLIPCPDCCYAMFCNEECRTKAFKDFHKIDCKLLHLMTVLNCNKAEVMALRTVIYTRCTLGSCEALKEIILKAESENDPLLQGFTIGSDGKKVLDSSNYSPIHMLVSNIDKMSADILLQKAITSSVLLHLLLNYTSFFDDCGVGDNGNGKCLKKECINLYGGLLLQHNVCFMSSAHSINTISPTLDGDYTCTTVIGGSANAFLSLLNHSCAPNVIRFERSMSTVLIALRPIKKGQQLFDSYGCLYQNESFQERQNQLSTYYKFTCKCEACLNKWPVHNNLPSLVL